MIGHKYLKHCLDEIEKKLGWKPSSSWTESDFKKLSKEISEASNISISPHTLKRLFGKIKYKKYYNPQLATKDALVKFLGYREWEDFISKKKNSITDDTFETKIKATGKSYNKYFIIASFILLILLIYYFNSQLRSKDSSSDVTFEFNVQDSIGTVPFTVTVDYNLVKYDSDSLRIDFDMNHPVSGHQIKNADITRFKHNFTYQIPGYYKINLLDGKSIISTHNVLAKSKEWNSYFVYESHRNKYWIDNEIKTSDSLGYLYFSPKLLETNGFNINSVYYIVNRLYKDFKIDGDNFELSAKFKNSSALGGITCYDFIINLVCENNSNYLKLMENGCSQFSGIKVGNKIIEGFHEDLSLFSLDLDSWNILKLIITNNHVKVIINRNMIFEFDYEGTNGNIIGLENILKGSGMLDYIHIKDLNTNHTFIEDFNN